jgi:hypothetical protein
METAQRSLALLQILLAAFLACGASSVENDPKRCKTDALEKWYCATNPDGTAVVDDLGRVVCAPGACVKVEEQGWICSSLPGGRAAATPKGPVCDGECRTPEATDCEKV